MVLFTVIFVKHWRDVVITVYKNNSLSLASCFFEVRAFCAICLFSCSLNLDMIKISTDIMIKIVCIFQLIFKRA